MHDIVIIDTAGRLQNKQDLMNELAKIRRVVEKNVPVSEVLLVLDATTGQNGLTQARQFTEAVEVTARIEAAVAAAIKRVRFMVSSSLKLWRSGFTSRSERRDGRRMHRNWRSVRPAPALRSAAMISRGSSAVR